MKLDLIDVQLMPASQDGVAMSITIPSGSDALWRDGLWLQVVGHDKRMLGWIKFEFRALTKTGLLLAATELRSEDCGAPHPQPLKSICLVRQPAWT